LLCISRLRGSRLNISRLRTRGHFRRRSDTHWSHIGAWLLGLQLAGLRDRNGLPFIGLDGRLPLRKRQRSGWRRRLGDDGTRLNRGGRLIAGGGTSAEDRLFRRNDCGRTDGDLRCGHFALINAYHIAPNGLSGDEVLTGSGGDPAGDALVYIGYIGDVFVDHGGVVVVVDHRLIHGGVRNVHVVNVGAADVIRRHVDFARSQWEPSDVYANSTTNADGEMSDRLLTVAEAAEMLRTSERFPRRLIAERRIRFTRVGRHVRIPESALHEFISARLITPMTHAGTRKASQR